MDRLSVLSEESSDALLRGWVWRRLPSFWTLVIVLGLLAETVSLVQTQSDRVRGGQGLALLVLLIALVAGYRWLSEGRLYGEQTLSERRALLPLTLQLIALVCLTCAYDSSFAWFSLSLVYQIIGGFSRRHWTLPLVGVGIIFVSAVLTSSGHGLADTGLVTFGVFLIAVNVGIALFIQVMDSRYTQLQAAFERLWLAYGSLTDRTAQAEEVAILRERTRLARSLHDEIGQTLVILNVKLEAAQLLYDHDPVRGASELETARALIRSTMTDLRQTVADLRSPELDYADFPTALERLGRESQIRTGISVTSQIEAGLPLLPIEVRQAFWYVVREALSNSERHASATHIRLSLERRSNELLLRIIDDGCGITPDDLSRPGHYGILGMHERIQALGGTFSIGRGVESGTRVEISLTMQGIQQSA